MQNAKYTGILTRGRTDVSSFDNGRSQFALNPLANSFRSKVDTPQSLSLSNGFEDEESTSDMEIILEPGTPMQNEFSINSFDHNDPSMVIIETETNHDTTPLFYSPREPSEHITADKPEVVEADTPDLSYLESGETESVCDLLLMNSYISINNYVFINAAEFGAYYFFMLCL